MRVFRTLTLALGLLVICRAGIASEPANFAFDFGSGQPVPGCIQVTPDMVYSKARGFGFDLESKVSSVPARGAQPGFCTSGKPFFFSVALPEGNYNVTVTLGDPNGASTNTVKAESRRLMLENVTTPPGQIVTRTFTVNVRTPAIASGGGVRLKSREQGPPMVLHWDDKLTLEFNGARPCVSKLEVRRSPDAPTVFLAGDSTVTDQPNEPWNSWGQMLPRFFKPGIAIANHAESGESCGSFFRAKRFDKILADMKPGDYLLIQFGHNDQKSKAPNAGPYTSYKSNLVYFVSETRKHGGVPVLVTPMHRLRFGNGGAISNSLGDYPEAVRQAAREEKTPLIDLNAMSKTLYEALGPTQSPKAFQDGTHHNNYGSYELARCVVEGIRAGHFGLEKFLAEEPPQFDPAHPDPLDRFDVPPSPMHSTTKPEGN